MNLALRLLWVGIGLIVVGCKHPPTFVGVWKGTILQTDATATFKDEKNVDIDLKVGSVGAAVSATYETTAKDLTITVTDYKPGSMPDSLKKLADSLISPLKGRPLKMHYQFNNENEVAITYQGKTDVLKRQAEAE